MLHTHPRRTSNTFHPERLKLVCALVPSFHVRFLSRHDYKLIDWYVKYPHNRKKCFIYLFIFQMDHRDHWPSRRLPKLSANCVDDYEIDLVSTDTVSRVTIIDS